MGTLIYLSPRRKPGSSSLFFLDSGFRRNDMLVFNQHQPKFNDEFYRVLNDAIFSVQ